jgi:ABC-2 type transport system permease protein
MLEEASAHFYKQWKIMSKRPGDIALISIYPLISILSLGIFAYFVITRGSPPEAMLFILVGVIVWDIYNVAERATSYGITLDIWSGCLKHTFTGSSSLSGFVLGNSLFGLFNSISVLLIMGALGIGLFGFNIFTAGLFLLNLLFVFVFATAFGLIINSQMITNGEKYMSLIWITPGLIMIFSGIYYPIEILPLPVQAFSLALPTTHSLISLRASMGFSPELAVPALLTGALLSLAYLALSLLLFRWAIKRSKVTGILTRY